jgi:hypothetical protein
MLTRLNLGCIIEFLTHCWTQTFVAKRHDCKEFVNNPYNAEHRSSQPGEIGLSSERDLNVP